VVLTNHCVNSFSVSAKGTYVGVPTLLKKGYKPSLDEKNNVFYKISINGEGNACKG